MKIYKCEHCGNMISFVKDAGVPVMCCGQKMVEMVPGTSDGAAEKHVPVIKQEGPTRIINSLSSMSSVKSLTAVTLPAYLL